MESAPTVVEQCAAAVVKVDPPALILDRAPGLVRLQTEGLAAITTVLVAAESAAQLEAAANAAAETLPRGKMLRLVAVDGRQVGAAAVLEPMAKALKAKRVPVAMVWTPGK